MPSEVGTKVFHGKNQSCSPCRETHRTGGNYANYDAVSICERPLDEALGRERTPPSAHLTRRGPVHYCCGVLSEGRGHHLALPVAAPTYHALIDASWLGAQAPPDRILRAPCGSTAACASFVSTIDALELPCRSCSFQASRSYRPPLQRCCRLWFGSTLRAAALIGACGPN